MVSTKATTTDTDVASSTKRRKTGNVMEEILSEGIQGMEDHLRHVYAANQPYPHAVLENLFDSNFLQQVILEIKDNSKVNFKESDLFRVYQSIDLANLDQGTHGEIMPHVVKLRQVLYSNVWRSFIERVTGLSEGTLTSQVDCAANCHIKGCHLLCHDDVIGTRRVSYIIYLTNQDWTREEGGALELYDSTVEPRSDSNQQQSQHRRVPDPIPQKTVLPLFNSMALFTVEPGYSFHAVQEVLGDRPRLSLQGWYHAAAPPANFQESTLSRLKQASSNEDGSQGDAAYAPIAGPPANVNVVDELSVTSALSPQDSAYLAEYINGTYLTAESLSEIRDRFEEDSSVQLHSFLRPGWADKLQAAGARDDQATLPVTDDGYYAQGVTSEWKLVGPSHKQRFLQYTATKTTADSTAPPAMAGELLSELRHQLFDSAPFHRFLRSITNLGLPTGQRSCIRRFRRGLDYTVAHYGLLTREPVLDTTLCFVAGRGGPVRADENDEGDDDDDNEVEHHENEADLAWQSGDVGGFECYIAADDEDVEAAAEYNQDDDTELLSVPASNNTLSLVYRDPGTIRFVKYISASAPSSRWDIAVEYRFPEAEEGEEGKDEEGKPASHDGSPELGES